MKVYPDAKGRPALLCLLIGHELKAGQCCRPGCQTTNLEGNDDAGTCGSEADA
jgi:hypothetical protein